MLFRFVAKIKNILAVVTFGLRILRWCGLRVFFSKMAHQLYGHTIFLVTTDRLDTSMPESLFRNDVKLVSSEDIDELFHGIRYEDNDGRYQLLVRKWYHQKGFGDCYVLRTADTGEICHARWLITPEHVKRLGWEDRFPLAEDEIMMENVYTFQKYRRQGALAASNVQLRKIALQQGFKRFRGYADETNTPLLKWIKKAGLNVCARVSERHFLFRVTRKTLEEYDPPLPVEAVTEIK